MKFDGKGVECYFRFKTNEIEKETEDKIKQEGFNISICEIKAHLDLEVNERGFYETMKKMEDLKENDNS